MADQDLVHDNLLETFVEYVRSALEIAQLEADTIDEIAADENAFVMGLGIVAVAGVAVGVGTWSLFGVIAYPVFAILSAVFGAGILHLLATQVFKADRDFIFFFRPFTHGWIVCWPLTIPYINVLLFWVSGLWLLVVTAFVLERVYGLERPRAIAVVAIPTVTVLFLAIVFGTFLLWMLFLFGLTAAVTN